MNTQNPTRLLGAGLLAAIALSTQAVNAQVITLTFEGLANNEAVNNFYNGGTGGNGSGPGVNYGVSFGSNGQALIDFDAGGTGNIGGEPSGQTVLYFLSGSAVLNYSAGFTTGFSFYYSAPFFTGSVNVYDGVNATGNLLATISLPLTPNSGAPDPNGQYSPLIPTGVSFSGTARSIDFAGTANFIVFDDITFGSAVPTGVPEPSTYAAILAVAAIGGHQWYRRRKAA